MELDVPHLLAPAEGQGEAITDTPRRELRILCEHEWLHVTWTCHASGELGADPHVHLRHVDVFYVLAGELGLQVGPHLEPLTATPGTVVMVPPGVVHGFANDGPEELRFLNFHAPGSGFADYLRGRNDDFDQHPPPADGGRPPSDAIVTPPGGGERFGRDDRTITILGELAEISLFRLEVFPNWPGIRTHAHDERVDTFFVLEGEAELVHGDEVVQAGPGSFYAALPGARHGVRNDRGGRIVFLNVHGPDSGFAADVRGL
ncbi:MAG: cupin domain-containing protein [Verrucomicrobiota bacterium]